MALATLNPWQVLDQLQNESVRNRPWQPLVDIVNTADGYAIDLELPGVDAEKVDIKLDDNQLRVSGEKVRRESENKNYRYRERAYGQFQRTFKLPEDADVNNIQASFNQGVLTVTIGKLEQVKPRTIEIKVN